MRRTRSRACRRRVFIGGSSCFILFLFIFFLFFRTSSKSFHRRCYLWDLILSAQPKMSVSHLLFPQFSFKVFVLLWKMTDGKITRQRNNVAYSLSWMYVKTNNKKVDRECLLKCIMKVLNYCKRKGDFIIGS